MAYPRFVVTDGNGDGSTEIVYGHADTLDDARNIAAGKRHAEIWYTPTGECEEISECTDESDGECCLFV